LFSPLRASQANTTSVVFNGARLSHSRLFWRALLLIPILLATQTALGQRPASRKLPSAEKIVEKYVKAIGGKKRIVSIRDVVLDWTIELQGQSFGVARHQLKAAASWRSEMTFANGQIITAANSSSAWSRGIDGELRTLTGAESGAAKLLAVLESTHLIDFKKNNIAARTLSIGKSDAEDVYVVEFSTRSGGRLVYSFSRLTGLITKIDDSARNTSIKLSDYRAIEGVMLPHILAMDLQGTGQLTLKLQKAKFNTGLQLSIFDAPPATEVPDVAELLRAVERNQDQLENRFTEYSFMQTETDREIDSKGAIKKETSKTYEVYPLPNREAVLKLVAENGVPLSAERATKEGKRVQEEFAKAERERDKDAQKVEKRREEHRRRKAEGKNDDDDIEISQFLKMCEFVSPRRERFRGRDVVVFDFRPRPGYRPRNRQEDLISKLVGVVWIDPEDRQVIRLEARLAEGFKMAGGLLFSLRPGAAFVMEQTRMNEGVWLPRLAQINLSMKVLLFAGKDFNKTIEWSDYKHFRGDVSDYKLEVPKTTETRPRQKP
jgi:hypothetical protein